MQRPRWGAGTRRPPPFSSEAETTEAPPVLSVRPGRLSLARLSRPPAGQAPRFLHQRNALRPRQASPLPPQPSTRRFPSAASRPPPAPAALSRPSRSPGISHHCPEHGRAPVPRFTQPYLASNGHSPTAPQGLGQIPCSYCLYSNDRWLIYFVRVFVCLFIFLPLFPIHFDIPCSSVSSSHAGCSTHPHQGRECPAAAVTSHH